MKDDEFNKLLKAGARAAKVFALNMPLLTNMDIFAARDISDWKVEGCDFILNVIRWLPLKADNPISGLYKDFSDQQERTCLRPQYIYGSAEVKGIGAGKFVHRNDTPVLSVPFAIWDGNREENGKLKYTREKYGSLKRFLNPDEKTLSAEPLVLEYIAEDINRQGEVRPFVSIAFTDFPELKRRLIAYAAENGMDLLDWHPSSIPTGAKAWEYKRGELIFTGNMWQVPLSLLIEIAYITIIGDKPTFYRNGACSVETQEKHYQYLFDHAAKIVPQSAIKLDGEIPRPDYNQPVYKLLLNGVAEALQGKLYDRYGKKI